MLCISLLTDIWRNRNEYVHMILSYMSADYLNITSATYLSY